MRRFIALTFLTLASISYAEPISLPIPELGWHIDLDAPIFLQKQGSQSGPNYIYRANSDRFNLSIFVEPQAHPGGSKECFEHYWPLASRNPMISKPTIQFSNTQKYYRVEYKVQAEANNQTLIMQNVNYYFMFEGKWVDVHISIIHPTESDAAIIAAFDKGLSYSK